MGRDALTDIDELTQRLLQGDKRAAARLLTMVENRDPGAQEAITKIHSHTGKAHVIGITGPPGVGKSTLIERLVRAYRDRGEVVGVVAVDPTSPFSGGAFLGDRVRMQSLSTDGGVFIRSMATRGGVGGLSRATRDAVRVLEAWGAGVVIVETVGAGQSETRVIGVAETVVVLLSPGSGDEIQALKAGLMEIADVYVVNKADLEGSDRVMVDVRGTLSMEPGEEWKPPVLKAVAKTGEGIPELMEALDNHREYREKNADETKQRRDAEDEVMSIVRDKAADHLLGGLARSRGLEEAVGRVMRRETDPYTAVDELLSSTASEMTRNEVQGLEMGLVHVYTGDGKGKTSAALGLALRALGRGLRVHVVQFIKGHGDYGEHHVARELPGLEMVAFGRGEFIEGGSPSPEDMRLAGEALDHARGVLGAGRHDIVILDEVNVAVAFGLIRVDDVLGLISSKPPGVELVLTGRGAPPEFVEAADLVTEMREVKHPFKEGIGARKGIEYD